MTNCKLYENSALAYGGGISNSGNTTLSGSIIFGNTAPVGADIANDIYAGRFGMDDIENVKPVYEEEGVTPVEWIYDCTESTPDIEAMFDNGNPNSLLKLVYEDHRSGNGDTGDDTGDSGENTGDDTGNTEGGADNTGDSAGNTGDNGDNAGGNTGTGNDTGNINAGDNSGNDGTGDKENTGNNTGAPETSAAKNENTSQTTNNTDSHENKSTTTTTTNYYYADNTPTSTPNLPVLEKQNNNNSSVVPKEEAVSSENVNDNQTVSDNMQIPDNIKLNLYNVDIVYEMTDGISDIAISNEKGLSGQSGNTAVVSEPSVTAGTAPDDRVAEDKPFSANWYEIIKMVLLAAILLVVIPRTRIKKTEDIIEE